MRWKRIPANNFDYWSWDNQVSQYPRKGEAGISYFKGVFSESNWVDCLLFRNEKGDLVGVLNYYNQDEWAEGVLAERKGNICLFVKPKERGKGIGKKLLAEGIKRFGIILEDQMWTPTGFQMLESFLKTHNNDQGRKG